VADDLKIAATTEPVASPDVLTIDFGAWKEKFSKFIEESSYQPKLPMQKALPENASEPAELSATELPAAPHEITLSFEAISHKWDDFLQNLEKQGKGLLCSNMKVCELKGLKGHELMLLCSKQFAFEMLTSEPERASEALSLFFQTPIYANFSIDRELVKATTEKSPYELFQELAEKNKLIKYLVDEFGAELIY